MKLRVLFEGRLNRNTIKSIIKKEIDKLDIFSGTLKNDIQNAIENAVLKVASLINAKRIPTIEYYSVGYSIKGEFTRRYDGEVIISLSFMPEKIESLEVINAISHEISHYVQWVKSGYRENILDPAAIDNTTGLGLVKTKKLYPGDYWGTPQKNSMYGYYSRPEEIMAFAGDAADYFKAMPGDPIENAKNFNILQAGKHQHAWMGYYQIKTIMPRVFKRFLKEVIKNLND